MPNIALELGKNAGSFGVNSAYGKTQTVDGAEFAPVALTCTGFGGGAGGAEGSAEGEGGGGGGFAIPLGVYVRREEGLRFEPNMVSLLAGGVPAVWCARGARRR